MAEKDRAALKAQTTNAYKIGVSKGTTVANTSQLWQDAIDSFLVKAEGEGAGGTKTFTTTGSGSAYAVTDAEIVSNSNLDGKPFFIIFNEDSLDSATITFNALPSLTIKMVGKDGKADTEVESLKANVCYVMTKEFGVNEIYIRAGGGVKINDAATNSTETWSSNKIEDRAQKSLIPVAATGSFGIYTASIPHISILADLSNYFYCIHFDTSFGNGDTININSLGDVTISMPLNSDTGKAGYLYLFRYDGLEFKAITQINYPPIDKEIQKGFFSGAMELARIKYSNSAVTGMNFTMAVQEDFNFCNDYPIEIPTNYIALTPPNVADETGGIKVVSTYLGSSPPKIAFPEDTNSSYEKNFFTTNNSFENEFPPFKHQDLTDGASVDFYLRDGFLANLTSGSATARTIDFKSVGAGGSGRINIAHGYIYLYANNSIDVTFYLDGSDVRVLTQGGGNPLTIAANYSTNIVRIDYTYYYPGSGSRLFIDTPKIYQY